MRKWRPIADLMRRSLSPRKMFHELLEDLQLEREVMLPRVVEDDVVASQTVRAFERFEDAGFGRSFEVVRECVVAGAFHHYSCPLGADKMAHIHRRSCFEVARPESS